MSQRCDRVHTEENLRGPRLSHSPRLQPGGEDLFLLASVRSHLDQTERHTDTIGTHPESSQGDARSPFQVKEQ